MQPGPSLSAVVFVLMSGMTFPLDSAAWRHLLITHQTDMMGQAVTGEWHVHFSLQCYHSFDILKYYIIFRFHLEYSLVKIFGLESGP